MFDSIKSYCASRNLKAHKTKQITDTKKMIQTKLNLIFISCSVFMVVQCRITFQIKDRCKEKRDVTLLFGYNYDGRRYNFPGIFVDHRNKLKEMHRIVKPLLKYKGESCLNLSLATLASYPMSRAKVHDLKSADTFFGQKESSSSDLHGVSLKEYLHLFVDRTQPPNRKRTLVIFTGEILNQDYLDILHKLQTESHVVIILVSLFSDISSLKQFKPHLKFYALFGEYDDLFFQQLVDVIKNPHFNLHEFDKHLPGFKNKSCLKKAKVIPVVSVNEFSLGQRVYKWMVGNIILPIKYHSGEVFTVQPLFDNFSNNAESHTTRHFMYTNKYYELNFDKRTSLAQIKDTGIMKGTERKIFLLIFIKGAPGRWNRRLSIMKKLLETSKQTVGEIEMSPPEKMTDDIIDLLVKLGCN